MLNVVARTRTSACRLLLGRVGVPGDGLPDEGSVAIPEGPLHLVPFHETGALDVALHV